MKYAAKKLLTLLVTMLIVSFLAFFAFSLVSGDAAIAQLGTEATPERVAALRAELGLDRPLLVRYGEWLSGDAVPVPHELSDHRGGVHPHGRPVHPV